MSDSKNPHAVALGRLGGKQRGKNLSPKELSKIGKHGASKRQQKLSKAERSRIAALAAQARWKKKRNHV
jgi:hypothetical protein